MISEPEMAGEFDAAGETDVLDVCAPPTPRPREPLARGPWTRWWWALGGALVASALWATSLVVYAQADRSPDLHGYRLDKDPCPDVRLKSIGAAIAPREPAGSLDAGILRHAALDRARCYISLRSDRDGGSDKDGSHQYSVAVTIALHKRTDPREEFEAERNATELGVDPQTRVDAVPDLGDKAYLLSLDNGETELRVLDGGAVLSLRLSVFFVYDRTDGGGRPADGDEKTPDLSAYQSALISDMRDLMSTLKH
ncbi:hypothetical protein [Streptomyces sp. NPDC058382]|uniref:hypothetical protein n=1 Tax=unclassified Streptomyces TaxID=2593676 RepID=UPI00363C3985